MRGSGHLYMLVNALHILGIGLLLGAILPLDLRLIGLGRTDIRVLGPFLVRAAALGLGIAVASGFALWSIKPQEYLSNAAFRWKAAIIVLGLINVTLQHRSAGWRQTMRTGHPAPSTRVLALVSALIWCAALLAGRWIGFL